MIGEPRPRRRGAAAAHDADVIAVRNIEVGGENGVQLDERFGSDLHQVGNAPGLRTALVMGQYPAGRQVQRVLGVEFLRDRPMVDVDETRPAIRGREGFGEHARRAIATSWARPVHASLGVEARIVDADSLPGVGVSAYELLDSLGTDDGPSALLVMGTNPVVSAPRSRSVTDRLRSLDLLVVCDPFLSETAELADVVLPVAQWAEESGTMTNLEGRVLQRQRLMPPPAGVRTDLEVLSALADRLGCSTGFAAEPAEVFEELRLATAGAIADYSGIDATRLNSEVA